MKFEDLNIGDAGKVVGYNAGSRAFRQRLLAMGLTPDTEFELVHRAPLGDPVQIKIRGYRLSLRQSEVDLLAVERLV